MDASRGDEFTVSLTEADRVILESYKSMAEGLSTYLGEGYEIVLHSLENLDQSVIKIFNGYHTGRKEGAPITDLALEMLSQIKKYNDTLHISYFCKNRSGEPLHSTTIAIKGAAGRIIGLLCINFYLNTPLYDVYRSLFPQPETEQALSENFANDISDVIEKSVNEVRMNIISNPRIPANLRNKEIIAQLNDKGIFNLKDSVVRTAEILGISKNTVYMHIRNLSVRKCL
jgi:predicted transcriptional regulator YheO